MDFDIFIKRDVKRARDIVYCKILCSSFVRVGKILYYLVFFLMLETYLQSYIDLDNVEVAFFYSLCARKEGGKERRDESRGWVLESHAMGN
ncbi:hypothetical protein L1887_03557 [Cichorium endivia]|nr:hypothetical protein L1887_03557 [Cichorium endivia]